MKKSVWVVCLVVAMWLIAAGSFAQKAAPTGAGEAKFKEHCMICHPDGGNIVNPQKTLHKKDREANNIRTEADILKIMRNPGPGMTQFDEKTVPDKDARAIAAYILKTFK